MPASDAHIEDHQLHEIDALTSIRVDNRGCITWSSSTPPILSYYNNACHRYANISAVYPPSGQAATPQRQNQDRRSQCCLALRQHQDRRSWFCPCARRRAPQEASPGRRPVASEINFCITNDRAGLFSALNLFTADGYYSKRMDRCALHGGRLRRATFEDACCESRSITRVCNNLSGGGGGANL